MATKTGNGNVDTAKAVFSIVTGTTTYLQVVVSSTSTFSGGYNNADALSGFFFEIAGDPTLNMATSSAAAHYGVATSGYSSLLPSFGKGNAIGTSPPNLAGKNAQLAFSIVGSNFSNSKAANDKQSRRMPMPTLRSTSPFRPG